MRTKLDQSIDSDVQRRIQLQRLYMAFENKTGEVKLSTIGHVKIGMLNQTSFERRVKANVGRLRVRTNRPEIVSIVIGDQLHMR